MMSRCIDYAIGQLEFNTIYLNLESQLQTVFLETRYILETSQNEIEKTYNID